MQPKDRSTIAKVDGEECIMLSVNKQSGSNTVKVAQSAVDRPERGHRGKRCAFRQTSLWTSPTTST